MQFSLLEAVPHPSDYNNGETQIEEVSQMPFLRNSEWEPLPEVSQKVVLVAIRHKDDIDRPVLLGASSGILFHSIVCAHVNCFGDVHVNSQ